MDDEQFTPSSKRSASLISGGHSNASPSAKQMRTEDLRHFDPQDLQNVWFSIIDKAADGSAAFVVGDALSEFRDPTVLAAPGTDPFRLVRVQLDMARLLSFIQSVATNRDILVNEPSLTSAVSNGPGQPHLSSSPSTIRTVADLRLVLMAFSGRRWSD